MVDSPFYKNVKLFYIFAIASKIYLFLPIMSLYYRDNFGLSYTKIILIQVIFSIVAMIVEMPSGFYADTIGRKKIIIFGLALSLISITLFAVSPNYLCLCIASALAAVSNACISGSDSAFLFESLARINKQDSYTHMLGKITFWIFLLGGILATPIGYIAKINMRIPYFITLIPVAVALVAVCLTKETLQNHLSHQPSIWRQAAISWNHISKNRILVGLLFITSFIIFILEFGNQVYQLHLDNQGTKKEFFGFLYFLFSVEEAFSAKYAYLLSKNLSQPQMVAVIHLTIAAGFFGMALWSGIYGAIISYSLICMARGAAWPVLSHYIHCHTNDDVRASILSLASFLNRMFFMFLGVFFAIVADNWVFGLNLVFGIIGFCFLAFVLLWYFLNLRQNHLTAKTCSECIAP